MVNGRATVFHLASAVLLLAGHVSASPLQVASVLQARADGIDGSIKIWVPLLVVALIITGSCTIMWSKRRARSGLTASIDPNGVVTTTRAPRATTAGSNGGVRELTAAQLAGESASTAHPPRARRARRPRRTPSQISTTSLPEYQKDPGELELVIVRAPDGLDDELDREGLIRPRTIIMPSVGENDEGNDSSHSRSRSDSTIASYDRLPETPVDTPLLEGDVGPATSDSTNATSAPQREQTLSVPNASSPTRRSFDTLAEAPNNNASSLSISRTRSNEPPTLSVPIGDAPNYFEVVDLGSDDSPPSTTISPPPEAVTSHQRPIQNPNRMSGFRALFGFKQPSAPVLTADSPLPPTTPGHRRVDSTFSNISSDFSHSRGDSLALSPTQSRMSQAGGSRISLSAFRTLSRQRSTNTLASASASRHNLNSPSVISLSSISAPLSHTVVRSAFAFPKAGPTPDQLKTISTKEAFKSFGVPYGEDSIAYATRSRVDLTTENPPDFDFDAAGPSGSTSASTSEPPSSAAQLLSPTTESNPSSSAPSASTSTSALPSSAGPTAFKFPNSSVNSRTSTAILSRSESRASSVSYATARGGGEGDDGYATAQEGEDDDDGDDASADVDITELHQHLTESSEATVRPVSMTTAGNARRASTATTVGKRESTADTVGRRESVDTVGADRAV